jgi:hypothetical protein
VAQRLDDCGLELLQLYGQFSGAALEQPADEARHVKLVYFARKPPGEPLFSEATRR